MAAINMQELLKKPAGKAVKIPPLPIGNFQGKIKSYEYRKAPSEDKSPAVRFGLVPTGWPENITEDEKSYLDGEGVSHVVDLTKKSLRRDFYLSDNALVYLDEFLRSCGLDLSTMTYEEAIPKVVGRDVVFEVKQYVNQTTSEIGNDVGRVTGEAS